MAVAEPRDRIRSAFGDLDPRHEVEWFLEMVHENQRLTEMRFVRVSWLLLVFVLLFELLIGGAIADRPAVLGVKLPPETVREALPAAIAATYLGLIVIGLVRLRQSEIHDLTLEAYRPRLFEQGLHLYMRPVSLLRGSVVMDGVASRPRRLLIGSAPLVMAVAMVAGPPLYVVAAVYRCYRKAGEFDGLLTVSAGLAMVFCLYGLVLLVAARARETPAADRPSARRDAPGP